MIVGRIEIDPEACASMGVLFADALAAELRGLERDLLVEWSKWKLDAPSGDGADEVEEDALR